MPFNPEIIFSFSAVQETEYDDWLTLIRSSTTISSFEVPGDYFETDHFLEFYQKVFASDKKIVSVTNIIPATLTRNLSSCSENIKNDVVKVFKERLQKAAHYNVKFLNIDLGLNSIKAGFEIQEIAFRAQILQELMKTASKCGITLLNPIRFPKSFPSCPEWKCSHVLINSVMHDCFRSEIDIFPNEIPASKSGSLMKNSYYTADMIRFIYDFSAGSRLSANMHDSWKSSLTAQGYCGDIIFSPKIRGFEMLNEEFEQLDKASQTYSAG